MAKIHHPPVGKGIQFPITAAVACWIDLLGYGSMISRSSFNPLMPDSAEAIRRLRRFHRLVAEHSARNYPTLVMNDGAVAYRDLSLRSRSVTFDFVCRSWNLFRAINDAEARTGHPGARMVVATGFRARGRRAAIDERTTQFSSILRRVQAGTISSEQGIREAAQLRSNFDVVPQLQANFAFTKAYLAEQSGTKGGLPGARCYLDLTVFRQTPSWLDLAGVVPWSHATLDLRAEFGAVQALRAKGHPEGGPIEVRDGLEVAQHLSSDPKVLEALRSTKR